jgi:hypothetical protein
VAYTAEQYAAAGAWIAANIDNPELVAQTAAAFGISVADLTIAAQTVDSSITSAQVTSYLAPTSYTPPPEPVYAPPPEPVYTPPPEPVYYEPEPVYYPPPSPKPESLSVGDSMSYTPEQYAAAGQFIVDNINDPEKIALTAAQFGLTPQDLVDAVAAVGYTITTDQTLTYFDNAGIDYESLTVYTPEQYAAAGQFIVDNISNPDAIAIAAESFGLTVEQLAVAARTVDPTITVEQVQGYFQAADIGYQTGDAYFVEPTTGFVFATREELEDYQERMAADAAGVARLEAAKADEAARSAAALAKIEADAAAARATAAALQKQQAAAAAAAAKAAQDAAAASAAQAARDAAARAKAAADAKLAADTKAKADAAAAAKAKAEADAKAAAERARIAADLAKAKADAAAAAKAAADAAAKAKAGLIPQAEANKLREVSIIEANKVTQLEQEAAALPTGGGANLLPILLAVGAYFLIGG